MTHKHQSSEFVENAADMTQPLGRISASALVLSTGSDRGSRSWRLAKIKARWIMNSEFRSNHHRGSSSLSEHDLRATAWPAPDLTRAQPHAGAQEFLRIDCLAVDSRFIMQMRA